MLNDICVSDLWTCECLCKHIQESDPTMMKEDPSYHVGRQQRHDSDSSSVNSMSYNSWSYHNSNNNYNNGDDGSSVRVMGLSDMPLRNNSNNGRSNRSVASLDVNEPRIVVTNHRSKRRQKSFRNKGRNLNSDLSMIIEMEDESNYSHREYNPWQSIDGVEVFWLAQNFDTEIPSTSESIVEITRDEYDNDVRRKFKACNSKRLVRISATIFLLLLVVVAVVTITLERNKGQPYSANFSSVTNGPSDSSPSDRQGTIGEFTIAPTGETSNITNEPIQTTNVNNKPVQTNNVDNKPTQTNSVNSKSTQSSNASSKPVQTNNADNKPVQTESPVSDSADSEAMARVAQSKVYIALTSCTEGGTLLDSNTLQGQVYQQLWTEVKDKAKLQADGIMFSPLHSDDKLLEKYAMLMLYNTANGESWRTNTLWASDENPCSWYGASCSNNGCVNSIVLDNNDLSGVIPQELCCAPCLHTLNLSNNKLGGDLPLCLANLSLDLSGNSYQDSWLTSISNPMNQSP